MISPDYLQTMVRYACWQNESVIGSASSLGDDVRKKDQGAFFGSLHNTLNHLLWADIYWMYRLENWPKPQVRSIAESVGLYDAWEDHVTARREFDARLSTWAEAANAETVQGEVAWFSAAKGQELVQPKWMLFAHFFNHQTHHRGQVHALLTQSGGPTQDTDLPFGPGA